MTNSRRAGAERPNKINWPFLAEFKGSPANDRDSLLAWTRHVFAPQKSGKII
jgi:hypothetical protein